MGDSKDFQRAWRLVHRKPLVATQILIAAREVLVSVGSEDRMNASADLHDALKVLGTLMADAEKDDAGAYTGPLPPAFNVTKPGPSPLSSCL